MVRIPDIFMDGWLMRIDYFHLTKAFGAVAVANFPLHFMLAMKRSPLRWLFGLSYEGHANFMHRWLGRIINVLLYSHATLYLAFFWQTDRMTTRFLESAKCGAEGEVECYRHWPRGGEGS